MASGWRTLVQYLYTLTSPMEWLPPSGRGGICIRYSYASYKNQVFFSYYSSLASNQTASANELRTMPRLLVFAPCERVIFGQGDNSASLIVIIQQMQFQIPAGQPIPPGAGAFAHFAIFSQWQRLPADTDKTFEQRLLLSVGNENPVFDAIAEFQMTDRLHRVVANVPVMPVLHPGEYSLKIFVREKGQQNWGNFVGDYPLEVVHIPQPAAAIQ
ncbi:MAG TPA: hypothetical protein VI431_08750 [Candidatus Acidoferrum sp.]